MWLVFRKELLELLRDRKTLFFMIAMPILLFPIIFGSVAVFTSKAVQEAQTKVLHYVMEGADYAPVLAEVLRNNPQFKALPEYLGGDYKALIREEKLDFVLKIDKHYAAPLLEGGQSKVALIYNDAGLNLVQSRVQALIDKEVEDKRREAFAQLAVSEAQQQALLAPIVLEKQDVADKRESWGEKIGGLIPYIVFILCLQGAMYPATDLGAGEKERGTLETLLISPIPRHKLVLGKFLTIALAGVTSALITVSSMALWGVVLGQGMAVSIVSEFMGAIGTLDFVLMFLMLIPVVAIFASLLLSLSIYASSFKEAQSYMGGMMFLVILPIVLATLPGVTLDGGWAWVPITNVALAIKELIKGTMDYFALVGIFGSTLLIASAMIAFCIFWFNRERVLFR